MWGNIGNVQTSWVTMTYLLTTRTKGLALGCEGGRRLQKPTASKECRWGEPIDSNNHHKALLTGALLRRKKQPRPIPELINLEETHDKRSSFNTYLRVYITYRCV